MAYLVANPPRITQFRARRGKVTGCLTIHTAESQPDEVGPDTGTDNVARFIRDRTTYGSYHWLADSDSHMLLVPMHMAAYGDGTDGGNERAIHISAATQAHRWPTLSAHQRAGFVKEMAKAAAKSARWLKKQHGITVPAKRITRAESEAGKPGFISHGERDPGRRSDPGSAFPWVMFLAEYKKLMSPKVKTIDPDDLPHADYGEFWTAHVSMQFKLSEKQMAEDVVTIFDRAKKRGYKWVTGTEAGGDQLRALLKKAANDAGYMFFVSRDVWVCVQRSFVDSGYKTGYVHSIDAGRGQGKHSDRGVAYVEWRNDVYGDMTVGCIHSLARGRLPSDPNFELNDALYEDVRKWGRRAGKGNALVWLNGDVNDLTSKRDVFRGAPFTPVDVSLDKHRATHKAGPIDVQASYDRDGRVEALKWRVHNDKKIFLHGDHLFTEAQWGVQPVG